MKFVCQEVAHDSDAYWQTVALRDEVLRKPLQMKFSPEELKAENDSHHLAVYSEGEVQACLIMKPIDGQTVKMRQVATALAHQRKGVGKVLVAYAELFAWQKGFQTISLHARIGAVPFYQKMNYHTVGDSFEEVGIPHYKMIKEKSVR